MSQTLYRTIKKSQGWEFVCTNDEPSLEETAIERLRKLVMTTKENKHKNHFGFFFFFGNQP